MITLEEIQIRLREAIKTSNIPNKEIAKQIGVGSSNISKYLHENKYPSLDTFANLCRVLDVSADEILGLKD